MIRIRRGHEPAKLAAIRKSEVDRVRPIAAVRTPTDDDIKKKYQSVRDELWKRQHYKCCYCEHKCQKDFHDVEHYRPKVRADRGAGFPTHGYWWLAWSWSNLMFACPGCNRSGKNDLFPLAPGSVPLVAEEMPPKNECPLLLDPSAESALTHIRFERILKLGQPTWVPIGLTNRGIKTIEDVGLARDDLLELFVSHAENHVMPIVERIQSAIALANAAQIRDLWDTQAVPLLIRQAPYSLLNYNILDFYFPDSIRVPWALELKLE